MTGLFVGQKIIRLESVGSTNVYASNLLRDSSVPEGTIVWALEQREGLGRRGNSWDTRPAKNLTFSLILYPVFLPPARQFYLSKAISLALYEFVSGEVALRTAIKWPNDIYIEDRKVAGILVENGLGANRLAHSVVGIGINVNQLAFQGLPYAGSLRMFNGVDYLLEDTLTRLCSFIEARYLRLKADMSGMDREYLDVLMGVDRWLAYNWKNERVIAKVHGVDPEGRLNLTTKNGRNIRADMQEIQLIRESL